MKKSALESILNKQAKRCDRRLRLESLESRQMLSIDPVMALPANEAPAEEVASAFDMTINLDAVNEEVENVEEVVEDENVEEVENLEEVEVEVWCDAYDPATATITLSWNEVEGATQYNFEICHNGKDWLPLKIGQNFVVEDGVVTSTHTGVNPGSSRQYRISAVVDDVAMDPIYSDLIYPTASVESANMASDSFDVGATFTADYQIGALDPRRVSVAFQWFRGSEETGWEAIDGATEAQYVATAADAGQFLMVTVSGTGMFYDGEASAVSAQAIESSVPANPGINAYDPMTGIISIEFGAVKGAAGYVTEVCHNGKDWLPLKVQYTISEEGLVVSDHSGVNPGSSRQYRVAAVAEDGSLSEYAYTDLFYPTAEVVAASMTSDSFNVGAEFTADYEIGANDPRKVTVAYQWYHGSDETGWEAIDGATDAVYTATDADSGLFLKVVVTGTGDFYTGEAEAVSAEVIGLPAPKECGVVGYDATTGVISLASAQVPGAVNYITEICHNGKDWLPLRVSYRISEEGLLVSDHSGCNPGSSRQYRVAAIAEDGSMSPYAYSEVFYPTAEVTAVAVVAESFNVGDVFDADVTIAAKDPRKVSVAYQWYRGSEEAGWEAIDGANAAQYAAVAEDAGWSLKVAVEGTGSFYFGSAEGISAEIISVAEELVEE